MRQRRQPQGPKRHRRTQGTCASITESEAGYGFRERKGRNNPSARVKENGEQWEQAMSLLFKELQCGLSSSMKAQCNPKMDCVCLTMKKLPIWEMSRDGAERRETSESLFQRASFDSKKNCWRSLKNLMCPDCQKEFYFLCFLFYYYYYFFITLQLFNHAPCWYDEEPIDHASATDGVDDASFDEGAVNLIQRVIIQGVWLCSSQHRSTKYCGKDGGTSHLSQLA